jgi:Fis family transcriptional regulator, factor for inversion stimulation protein
VQAKENSVVKVQLENLVLHMYKTGIGYSEAVREFEKGFILTVLQGQKGNQVRAAQDLGMHRNTLRRMIHCLQIDIPAIRAVARRRPPQHALLDSPKKTERAL